MEETWFSVGLLPVNRGLLDEVSELLCLESTSEVRVSKLGELVATCQIVAAAVSVIIDVMISDTVVVAVSETTARDTVTVKVVVCSLDIAYGP